MYGWLWACSGFAVGAAMGTALAFNMVSRSEPPAPKIDPATARAAEARTGVEFGINVTTGKPGLEIAPGVVMDFDGAIGPGIGF